MKLVIVNIDAEQNDLLVPLDLKEGEVTKYLVGIYPNFDLERNLLETPVELHKGKMGYIMYSGLRIMMTSEKVLSRAGVRHIRKIPETNLPVKDLYDTHKAIDESDVLVLHFVDELENKSEEVFELTSDFVCTLSDLSRLTNGGWYFGDVVVKKLSCPGEGCVMSDVDLEEDIYIGHDLDTVHMAYCSDGRIKYIDPEDFLLWFGLDKTTGVFTTFMLTRGENKTVSIPGEIHYVGIPTEEKLKYIPIDEIIEEENTTKIRSKIQLHGTYKDVYAKLDIILDENREASIFIEDCEIYPKDIFFVTKLSNDNKLDIRMNKEDMTIESPIVESRIRFIDPITIYESLIYSMTDGDFRVNMAVTELENLKLHKPYTFAVFLYVLNRFRKTWKEGYPIKSARIYNQH